MAKTELFEMSAEERKAKIMDMETDLLFAELDDTIQFDLLNMGTDEWAINSDKRVYLAIVNELRNRLRSVENGK